MVAIEIEAGKYFLAKEGGDILHSFNILKAHHFRNIETAKNYINKNLSYAKSRYYLVEFEAVVGHKVKFNDC